MTTMAAVTCESCSCLVTRDNVSATTKENPGFTYCADCDEIAPVLVGERFIEPVLKALANNNNDIVNQALQLLYQRTTRSAKSILALRKALGSAEAALDTETILRSMYDASLQAEYIAFDPATAVSKATDYFDFHVIERKEFVSLIGKYTNDVTNQLATSPYRKLGEAKLNSDFARIAPRFKNAKDGWHGQNLRKFSKMQGREEEFDFVVKQLHHSTHSSSGALRAGYAVGSGLRYLMAGQLRLRALGAVISYNGVKVDEVASDLINIAKRNLITDFKTKETR